MKITEKILVIIISLSVLLALIPISGALFLSGILLGLLAHIYFYLGFLLLNNIQLRTIFKRAAYVNITAGHIVGGIGISWIFAMACVAFIFKLFSWPFSFPQLVIAILLLLITLIIAIIKMKKGQNIFLKNVIKRCLIFLTLCIILALLPQNFFMDIRHRHDPTYIK